MLPSSLDPDGPARAPARASEHQFREPEIQCSHGTRYVPAMSHARPSTAGLAAMAAAQCAGGPLVPRPRGLAIGPTCPDDADGRSADDGANPAVAVTMREKKQHGAL